MKHCGGAQPSEIGHCGSTQFEAEYRGRTQVEMGYYGGVWVAMWHCEGTRAGVERKHFLRQCGGENKKKSGDQKVPGL